VSIVRTLFISITLYVMIQRSVLGGRRTHTLAKEKIKDFQREGYGCLEITLLGYHSRASKFLHKGSFVNYVTKKRLLRNPSPLFTNFSKKEKFCVFTVTNSSTSPQSMTYLRTTHNNFSKKNLFLI